MKKISVLLLILALLCIGLIASASAASASLTVKFDKESYMAGSDLITAEYKITGIKETIGTCVWYYCVYGTWKESDSVIIKSLTGKVKFTPPEDATQFYFELNVLNPDKGRYEKLKSPGKFLVPLLQVNLSSQPTPVSSGSDVVRVYYSFSGGKTPYTSATYTCYIVDKKGKSIPIESGDLEMTNGFSSFEYKAERAEQTYVRATITDSEGRTKTNETGKLQLSAQVYTDFDKEEYHYHDEIKAAYEICGDVQDVEKIEYDARCWDAKSISRREVSGTLDLATKTGTIKFTPLNLDAVETRITYTIYYKDGNKKTVYSKWIPLIMPGNISVATTFDKETYNAGDTIKATYQLSGGVEPYQSVKYKCYSEGLERETVASGNLDTKNKTGTISFTPGKGSRVWISYEIVDAEGRRESKDSNTVLVYQPVSVNAYFSGYPYFGEENTLHYKLVGGSEKYTSGTYAVYASTKNGKNTKIASGNLDVSKHFGDIKVTPQQGSSVFVEFTVTDSTGKTYTAVSKEIELEYRPVYINTSFDKDSYPVGSEITVTWTIADQSGPYKYIEYDCYSMNENSLGGEYILY